MTGRRRGGAPRFLILLACLLTPASLAFLAPGIPPSPTILAAEQPPAHLTQPGETVYSLALRTGAAARPLGRSNRVLQPLAPFPVAGTLLQLTAPARPPVPSGRWHSRTLDESPAEFAAQTGTSPWSLAWANGMESPYRPLGADVFAPGAGPGPVRLPGPLAAVRITPLPAVAGQAMQIRAWASDGAAIGGDFEGHTLRFAPDSESVLALLGLGGFVEAADYHLNLQVGDRVWTSRVRTVEPGYGTEEIWLSDETLQYLDAEAIRAEQARLNAFFGVYSADRRWEEPWQLPVTGAYTVTSSYGTRRSYNGGPARSYHEGVDFNGLTGRPVLSPAAGTVVLAEPLYVRGNAIVLDHGMGVYSGYYHLSLIEVSAGEQVHQGQKLGEVGSTGLSTGSHLHWDVVVAGINVDGLAWKELTGNW